MHATTLQEILGIASPGAAPGTLRFSLENVALFQSLWRQSQVGGGKVKERGGTIVADAQGRLSLQNIGGLQSNSDTFQADYKLKDPSRYRLVGVFHTHPYGEKEGNISGVSFTFDDIKSMLDANLTLLVLQSGPRLFAYVRTGQAQPFASPNLSRLKHGMVLNNERLKGHPKPQANRITNERLGADTYKLAYYQGSNGVVTRVSP